MYFIACCALLKTKIEMEEADKRYLAFGFDQYYPGGGMGDMIDSFDTIPEAIECIKNDSSDYNDVYDRIKGVVVDCELYGYKY